MTEFLETAEQWDAPGSATPCGRTEHLAKDCHQRVGETVSKPTYIIFIHTYVPSVYQVSVLATVALIAG